MMDNSYHYPGEELSLFEEARNWKRYLASKLAPYIKGSVLEVGAGIGETTAYLLNKHTDHWTCLEPDSRLLSVLRKKIDDKILPSICEAIQGTVSDIASHPGFDTIIYIDVLEHIEDDKKEIAEALHLLKKNGHLIILSPAFPALYSSFDKAVGHYRRYTKKTLRQVANYPGLVEKKMLYLESAGALLLLLNRFFLKKKYPERNDIRIWQRIFIPVSKVADKILFYRLGKSIAGIWQYKN